LSRASAESSEGKLLKAGADRVIAPEVLGGQRMASLVLHPEAPQRIDALTQPEGEHTVVDELVIDQGSPLCGRALAEVETHTGAGVRVIAIRRAGVRSSPLQPAMCCSRRATC
jgi:voltage-gated potassium channel